MAATSRRIACPTDTMDSRAIVSGSARRIAASVIERAMMRSSCARGALLQRLEHLPDRLAVVIGGAVDRFHLVEVGRRRRAAHGLLQEKVFVDRGRAARGTAAAFPGRGGLLGDIGEWIGGWSAWR